MSALNKKDEGRCLSARAASLRPQPAAPSSRGGIPIAEPRSYADRLRAKGLYPLNIERTVKRAGDLELTGKGFHRVRAA